ncbi:MAG: PHB depolymerase family esterase [Geminicoccaceae bacterium]|nr:PHB depolymerase family esterase [Geminicoccaceae bacterium]
MNDDFAAAMRRATEATRGRDLAAATRIIQQALGGRDDAEATSPGAAPGRPRIGRVEILPPERSAEDGPDDAGPARRAGSARWPETDRRPLSEVVRALRRGTAGSDGSAGLPGLDSLPGGMKRGRAPAAPLPEGASFTGRTHADAAGSRSYRLYVPASVARGARPSGLVLMLHGCTQNPDDFAAGTAMNRVAEERGLLVAWPHQTRAHNPNACWNWFEPAHQGPEKGEPAILAGLARALVQDHGVPRERVFAAGLSAGGAMAAILARTAPDLFAAVGVHSGLAAGSARDVASAFAAMRSPAPGDGMGGTRGVRTIVFHGTADAVVHPGNAGRVFASAPAGGVRHERIEAGGRTCSRTIRCDAEGRSLGELWLVEGAGHAWSGGDARGSFADPAGPDASREMIRFFFDVT